MTLRAAIEHLEAGRLQQAEALLRQARSNEPGDAMPHYYLGNVLASFGNLAEAVNCYRDALKLDPAMVEAHHNLASILVTLNRPAEAEHHSWRAVSLRPDLPMVHNSHGIALAAAGHHEAAIRAYRQAVALDRAYAEPHNNMGNALRSLRRFAEAAACYRDALALRPELAEAHYHLGLAMLETGQLDEAEQSFRQALARRSDYADAHHDLGNLLRSRGELEEAEHCYRQAITIRPEFTEALCQWVHARQWLCDWTDLEIPAAAMHRHVTERGPGQLAPFSFLVLPDSDGTDQLACARLFAERAFEKPFLLPPLHASASAPNRSRLRIGYLSADYYEHATSYLLAQVIELHDRGRFELFGYSYGPDDQSPMRARMSAAFDSFRDIRALSDPQAAQRIADDGVDILVDLKGYTGGARLEIMAMRPAPVQVSWLGYPGTLGHPRLADYLIGDPVITPPEHAARYSESLALLPHCYQPNDRRREIAAVPTRPEAGLPERGFVFSCLCQPYKITPAMFDLWCELLAAVPDSVLWLLQCSPAARRNLRREAEARGISPERLVFAPILPAAGHLGRLQLADVALDTFPVGSHTTASDVLWVGVPLITLLGDSFVSRVAASIVRAADLPELIAGNTGEYCELALNFARHGTLLRSVRAKLAANRESCPLFDSSLFARSLESLFERMWDHHRSGRKGLIAP